MSPIGEKLRTLDALEEYFWLSENTFPRTTILLAEVEGPTTVDAWRDALNRVQQRYPLLRARIRKNPVSRLSRKWSECSAVKITENA
jgi:hypothetical protein